jgi:hypothetical protein
LRAARKGASSWLPVVSVAGRPSWSAGAHGANPVLFGAHLPAYPLGLVASPPSTADGQRAIREVPA